MKKARDRSYRWRRVKKQVVEAVGRSSRSDPRVFTEVRLDGRQVCGLLDSGATVSLLGKGCRELVDELGLWVQPYLSPVRTASGYDRSIIGRIKIPIEYQGKIRETTFYLFPYLEQAAYFGINFWRAFGLAPDVVEAKAPESKPLKVVSAMTEQIAHYADDEAEEAEPEHGT